MSLVSSLRKALSECTKYTQLDSKSLIAGRAACKDKVPLYSSAGIPNPFKRLVMPDSKRSVGARFLASPPSI